MRLSLLILTFLHSLSCVASGDTCTKSEPSHPEIPSHARSDLKSPYLLYVVPLKPFRPGERFRNSVGCVRIRRIGKQTPPDNKKVSDCGARIVAPDGQVLYTVEKSQKAGLVSFASVGIDFNFPLEAPPGSYHIETWMAGPGLPTSSRSWRVRVKGTPRSDLELPFCGPHTRVASPARPAPAPGGESKGD